MYGLLLENLADFIKNTYGDAKWEEVRRATGVEQTSFSTHQVYPENYMPRLVRKAIEILGITERELMNHMGEYFVMFVGQYGYDRVLSVLGRHLRDFLNGLDNLHEYLKFSYPRMRAPSFFCENESETGLTLHYRSKRKGFVYYTMGQIKQVAKHFYNADIDIDLVKEELVLDTHIVTFELRFDNRAYVEMVTLTREDFYLPVRASLLLDIFPFCIIFSSDMTVKHIGTSLRQIIPQLEGQRICDVFDLHRPMEEFRFLSILKRTNNIFELRTIDGLLTGRRMSRETTDFTEEESVKLSLKGQMMYMAEWKMMMFLATPIMSDLNAMISAGLNINDLSMHDFSRDLMMAGTQQSVELKLALDQEQQKSKKLEDSMRKLDEEMKRTDGLLYQMIPKVVADRLRQGANPVDTCQVFDAVTVLFSDIVTFTEISSRISPMEVVSMLNTMYSIFDRLTEFNGVYKVETIGDAYMVVGGAPEKEELHACKICDMAMDMVNAIKDLKDPSTGEHLQIRVGIHSGTVVAGVVGLKMPRYCLFGDTVNTASRMESTSLAMKIHISEFTKELLGTEYLTEKRGDICVKGKGNLKTFWLVGKENRATPPAYTLTKHHVLSTGNDLPVRGYSPITMEDIARRSLTQSPTLSLRRQTVVVTDVPDYGNTNVDPPRRLMSSDSQASFYLRQKIQNSSQETDSLTLSAPFLGDVTDNRRDGGCNAKNQLELLLNPYGIGKLNEIALRTSNTAGPNYLHLNKPKPRRCLFGFVKLKRNEVHHSSDVDNSPDFRADSLNNLTETISEKHDQLCCPSLTFRRSQQPSVTCVLS